MHDRTKIRAAAKAALVADAAIKAAGISVHSARYVPIPAAVMPALNVHTPSETVDDASQATAPWRIDRELSLVVECIARGRDEALADSLDAMAELVEAAMLRDDTLGGACGLLYMRSSELTVDIDAELPVGTLTLTFSAMYDTTFPVEGTDALPDFDAAHTVWDIVGDEKSADRAVDLLTDLHE